MQSHIHMLTQTCRPEAQLVRQCFSFENLNIHSDTEELICVMSGKRPCGCNICMLLN